METDHGSFSATPYAVFDRCLKRNPILRRYFAPLIISPLPPDQIRIDVTVSGTVFSGDGLYYGHSTLPADLAEDNFMDYVVGATSTTYTLIRQVI